MNKNSIASTIDSFHPPEPRSGAVTTRTADDEIGRLARALDNYIHWLDRRREWRESEATRRRAKRQARRQQQEAA